MDNGKVVAAISEDVEERKRALRRLLRLQLQQITPHQWQERSLQISLLLQTLLGDQLHFNPLSEYLGVFAPLDDEVRWQQNWELGPLALAKLAFPRVDRCACPEGAGMVFQHAEWGDLVLQTGFGGVRLTGPPPASPPVRPRICLIPGLAFTADGKRLGRGKGFYDRYLASNHCEKVGVCLAEFCLPDLPTWAHDQYMDYVVTDRQVFQVQNRK